jgi:hypothetical protein
VTNILDMQFLVFTRNEGRSGAIRNDRRVQDHRKMCHDVSVITDRVKIVALRKCSRKVSGAAIVRRKWCTWYSAKTPVGE